MEGSLPICRRRHHRLPKIQTIASHFSLKFIVINHKNNWLYPRIFHPEKFAGSLLVKILLAHSLSHAIQHRSTLDWERCRVTCRYTCRYRMHNILPEIGKTDTSLFVEFWGRWLDPLNWQSFIEIDKMALLCSATAWCSRGHTFNTGRFWPCTWEDFFHW